MEVTGRGASTGPDNHLHVSDEGDPEQQCQQCAETGETVVATGFCKECGDFLCSSCIQQHKVFRGTRGHKIQEGTDMPRVRPSGFTVEKCKQHPSKTLELYCESQDMFGCILCFTEEQNSWSNFKLITDLSKDYETSDEIKEIQNLSQQQNSILQMYKRCIQQYHQANEDCYEKSLVDYRSFRSKMEAMLDQLGNTVSTEAGQLKEENKKKLDSFAEQISSTETELDFIMQDMDQKRQMKLNDLLFIAAKRNRKQLDEVAKKIAPLKTEMQIQRYMFQADLALTKITEGETSMGSLKVLSGQEISATGEITVVASGDNKSCYITGMVEISTSELVVTDYDNNCVKKIDVNRNMILQRLALRSRPWDVSVLPDSRVAVTLPDNRQVDIISTDNGLVPCHSIGVDGYCLAISAIVDRLAVSFKNPGNVQILDTNGTILKRITTDTSGSPLFVDPRYLSLSHDHTAIYVTDFEKNAVRCLSTNGTVMWTYTDKELKGPLGVTTGNESSLYVCSLDSHSIHVVSSAGARQAIVSTQQFNNRSTQAICCSKSHDVLYLSNVTLTHCNVISKLTIH